jgi:hypothetical protein
MRLAARSTIIASALAIVAIVVPAALARPNLDPVTSGLTQSANPRPEVHANANHHGPQTPAVRIPPNLPRATASEHAAIRQAQEQEAQRLAYTQPKSATYSKAENNGYANHIATSGPRIVHVVSPNGRFDWGDAGIGAAGGLGLAVLGLGGAFAVSQQRRARRSKTTAATTS